MNFRWSENLGRRVLTATQNRPKNFAEKRNLVKQTAKTEKKSKKIAKTIEIIRVICYYKYNRSKSVCPIANTRQAESNAARKQSKKRENVYGKQVR